MSSQPVPVHPQEKKKQLHGAHATTSQRTAGTRKKKKKKKKKKCYTALTRLRRNEPLARERVQQGRTRGCHQPHFKKLERDERAEANNCPSATEVTWQAMKPVNRKRPAPDGGPKANKLSKVVKGFER
jgi:hypothetical protein